MKKLIFLCAVTLLLSAAATAQSSEKLTELINTEKTTYGQAAYLSAVFTGSISENDDYEKAVKTLELQDLLPEGTDPAKEISLQELSYICFKTARFQGGLLYRLFPGPRYAFRELKAKRILPPLADPSEKVSGRDTIALFNGCLPENDE